MKYETPTEFIDKFMKNEYSKMETVIERLLRENPGLKPTDLEIHYNKDNEPVAIYQKTKIFDFKESRVLTNPELESAKKIAEQFSNIPYGAYYDKKYAKPDFKKSALNCSDEVVPGSNERTRRIRQLIHEKIEINPQAFQELSKIISEMHSLMKEEHMALTDCNEYEADHFLDAFVDFNHFKKYVATDGKEYLSVDPKIGPKYRE